MPKVFVCSLDDGAGSIEFLPSFFEFLCASFYIKIVNKQYNVMKENLFTNTLKVIGVYYIILATTGKLVRINYISSIQLFIQSRKK